MVTDPHIQSRIDSFEHYDIPSDLRGLLTELVQVDEKKPNKVITLVELYLTANTETLTPFGECLLTFEKARAQRVLGHFDIAEISLEKIMKRGIELGMNDFFMGRVFGELGITKIYLGQLEAATEYFTKMLHLDDTNLNPNAYNGLGVVYQRIGDLDKAESYYQKCAELGEALGSLMQPAMAHVNIANIKFYKKDHQEAIRRFEMAIDLMETTGDPANLPGYSHCLNNLGAVLTESGDQERALSVFDRVFEIAIEQGQPTQIANVKNNIAETYRNMKDYPKFLELQDEAIEYSRTQGLQDFEFIGLNVLLQYYKGQEDFEKAYKQIKGLLKIQGDIVKNERNFKSKELILDKEREINALERKTLEIQDQNSRLIANNQELEQYAYIVAHDLREPVRTISGFSSLLTKRYKNKFDDKAKEYLGFINAGAKHMDQMLVDLLKYATVANQKPKMELINLASLVDELKSILNLDMDEVSIETQPNPLPIIRSNKRYLFMLFQNLIQNAIKFSPADRETKIKIEFQSFGKVNKLMVTDNGIGIKPEDQDKIFKIFNSLNRQDYEGTGIGLNICKKITRILGGNITVASEYGSWTTFTIELENEDQLSTIL